MKNSTIAFLGIVFLFVGIFATMITLVIMNNKNLKDINKSGTNIKTINLLRNENINNGGSINNSEFYGEIVDTYYSNNKQYTEYTLYGHFDKIETNPNITIAYSDDGKNFNLSGDSTFVTYTNTNNNLRTEFLSKYNFTPTFKYITVYIQGEVNNITCDLKLSI